MKVAPIVCPGRENDEYRQAEAKAARLRAQLVASGRTRLLRRELEVLEHGVLPRMGEPYWCQECSSRIYLTLCQMPELATALWAVGHTGDPSRPWRLVRMRCLHHGPSNPRRSGSDRVVVGFSELLSCGHITTTIRAKGEPPRGISFRICLVCALEDPGDSGRVMPAPGSVRGAPGLAGSPALSSSWLSVEELVAWVCRTEDYLRARLGMGPARVDWWDGDYGTRHRAMTEALGFLGTHVTALLRTKHAVEIGKELLSLAAKARVAGGVRTSTRLSRPCPHCDQRALMHEFASKVARCSACHATTAIDEDDMLRGTYVDAPPAKRGAR